MNATATYAPPIYAGVTEQHPYISDARCLELARIIRQGTPFEAKHARDELISSHIPLAVSSAARNAHRVKGALSISAEDDLTQVGLMTLCESVDAYCAGVDAGQTTSFRTYAHQAVYARVAVAAGRDSCAIDLKRTGSPRLRAIRKAVNEGASRISDIALSTGISEQNVVTLLPNLRSKTSLDVEGIDEPLDPRASDPGFVTDSAHYANDLLTSAGLTEIEERVISLYHGFDGDHRTFNEVAAEVEIGFDGTRRAYHRGLAKLKAVAKASSGDAA